MKKIIHTVESTAPPCRLDKYMAEHTDLFSRSQLRLRIRKILLNGRETKPAKKVKSGDTIEIHYSDPPPQDIIAESIPLDILFENNDVLVLNKKAGMAVHPGSGRFSGTLANALLYYIKSLKSNFAAEEIRPGIVHRLDRDTSGVIIVAKNPKAHEYLSAQFRRRKTKKTYAALVKGFFPGTPGKIEYNIARDPRNRKRFTWAPKDSGKGKTALTFYKTVRYYTRGASRYTHILFSPRTGRTHQLRIHALSQRCPILGDPIYSRRDPIFPDTGLLLHALKLVITLPGDDRPRTFKAPLPDNFKKILEELDREGLDVGI